MSQGSQLVDVVIVGGGPAGSAAGLTLLKRAGTSVALLESSNYEQPRIGESLTPGTRPLLEYLGVWDAFRQQQTLASFGSQAAWGTKDAGALDYMFTMHGAGWALDRVGLDRMLADTFRERGGNLKTNARFTGCVRRAHGWQVEYERDGQSRSIDCRYLIDASGRRGRVARQLNATRVAHDQLVGVAQLGTLLPGATMESMVLVEACEYGWWYSAPLPNNRVSTVLMSDGDIVHRLGAATANNWRQLLQGMALTRRRLRQVSFDSAPMVFGAISSCLQQLGGEGWVAVGDAAASHDPLSSSGIPHALGSGTQGALVAVNALHGDGQALAAYATSVADDFRQYLKTHWRYYQREQRFVEAPFWQRRQTPIAISADTKIKPESQVTSDHPKSIHLPDHLLRKLSAQLRPGHHASTIVSEFAAAHPQVSHQRIILGLQDLIQADSAETAESYG
ncbi:MAG: hypothetical protein DHS20C11_31980 [Lysobacteraceae bacterium]|nr:MAG: hypothetical protein DHS20C11_31980 [Xanthomonadaceae bacterium]